MAGASCALDILPAQLLYTPKLIAIYLTMLDNLMNTEAAAFGCRSMIKMVSRRFIATLAGHMSHQPPLAYQPPVIYQQSSLYPPGSFPGSQPYGAGPTNPQNSYTAPTSGAAGWMGPAAVGQVNPYSQQPYESQQPYQQQQQTYGQQPPYTQQQAPSAPYQQDRANQFPGYIQQQPAQYMPPTMYQPTPAPSGRKKALLVGCCYPGTSAALNGCINDVQCVEYCLKHRFGFKQEGCIVVS